MKIAISSDFAGYQLKEWLKKSLIEAGYEIMDVNDGKNWEKIDYVAAATNLVAGMRTDGCSKGIIVCGTGAGVSIAANKFKGSYGVPCESLFTAESAAVINNSNVLALGARVVGCENALKMAEIWLKSSLCSEFTTERREFVTGLYQKLLETEQRNMRE